MTCRSREEDFGTTTMTGWWFGSGMRIQLRCDDLDGSTGRYPSPHRRRTFCGTLKSGLEEGQRLSNGEQVNRLAGFVFEAWRVS